MRRSVQSILLLLHREQVHKGFLEQFESFTTQPKSGGCFYVVSCDQAQRHAGTSKVCPSRPNNHPPCIPSGGRRRGQHHLRAAAPERRPHAGARPGDRPFAGRRPQVRWSPVHSSLRRRLRCPAAQHPAGALPPMPPACSELTGVWVAQVWPAVPVTVINTGAPRVGDGGWEFLFTAVVGRAFRWVGVYGVTGWPDDGACS